MNTRPSKNPYKRTQPLTSDHVQCNVSFDVTDAGPIVYNIESPWTGIVISMTMQQAIDFAKLNPNWWMSGKADCGTPSRMVTTISNAVNRAYADFNGGDIDSGVFEIPGHKIGFALFTPDELRAWKVAFDWNRRNA